MADASGGKEHGFLDILRRQFVEIGEDFGFRRNIHVAPAFIGIDNDTRFGCARAHGGDTVAVGIAVQL